MARHVITLKDKGIISEWFYNGEYHWKYAEPKEPNWEQCTGCAYDDVSPEKEPCKSCVDNNLYTEQKPEKKYRPFRDCEELVKTFCNKWSERTGVMETDLNDICMPLIWVREKIGNKEKCLITGFCDSVVSFSPDFHIALNTLMENYEFLDGTPCGVEE